VINAGAEAYRGVIPTDCWHDPYMSDEELRNEIKQGVVFSGSYSDGFLVGVMGIQRLAPVSLIRHAYLRPSWQRGGRGSALLARMRSLEARPFLIGTWRDALWAIRFYQRHGFRLVPESEKMDLLARYWTVPRRQAEESVVLGDTLWFEAGPLPD
jgi:GNAT superfamily N-acetyltransferase